MNIGDEKMLLVEQVDEIYEPSSNYTVVLFRDNSVGIKRKCDDAVVVPLNNTNDILFLSNALRMAFDRVESSKAQQERKRDIVG